MMVRMMYRVYRMKIDICTGEVLTFKPYGYARSKYSIVKERIGIYILEMEFSFPKRVSQEKAKDKMKKWYLDNYSKQNSMEYADLQYAVNLIRERLLTNNDFRNAFRLSILSALKESDYNKSSLEEISENILQRISGED